MRAFGKPSWPSKAPGVLRAERKWNMKPIRMAILGAGDIAGHMAAAMALCPDVTPFAVAAREESRAAAFAKKHGFSRYYGSYAAMLQDKDVELVYIAVPHSLHSEYALLCLEAGKHVVVEKPFAANEQQAKAVTGLARAKGLMAAEGLWMRYLPNVESIRHICASGMIGKVNMLTGEIGYHLSQARLFDPALAGGALLDIGVYALALADVAFGYDVAELASSATLTARGVDEASSFILQYKTGQMASFSVSITYRSTCRGTLWGSEGYADIGNLNRISPIRVYDKAGNETARYENPPVENAYVFELASLAKALRAGRVDTPEAPHGEILKRMHIMDRLRAQWDLVYPFERPAQ